MEHLKGLEEGVEDRREWVTDWEVRRFRTLRLVLYSHNLRSFMTTLLFYPTATSPAPTRGLSGAAGGARLPVPESLPYLSLNPIDHISVLSRSVRVTLFLSNICIFVHGVTSVGLQLPQHNEKVVSGPSARPSTSYSLRR